LQPLPLTAVLSHSKIREDHQSVEGGIAMPRLARKRSDSGIYHVLLRGTNKQRIFHEEADYQSFLDALRAYRDLCGFQLYAWCLMPNHVP